MEAARVRGHSVHALASNLLEMQALEMEVSRAAPDVVIHLAAISFVGHTDQRAFYEVNVIGTMNLLDALERLPRRPSSVLLSSTANVYGNCLASPIVEEQIAAPANHYAASKLTMEQMSRARLNTLPLFWTRPFNYTGTGQAPDFLIPKLVKHAAQKSAEVELGNLEVEREFNDVRFVCEAYLELLQHAEPGKTYNVCTGRTYSLRNVLEQLAHLTRHTLVPKIRSDLVRPNEIKMLCGDPSLLHRTVGRLKDYTLQDTLSWMLAAEINNSTFRAAAQSIR
jgi:GDP-6-deoxy-D-talose 4-dehydrogenase